MNSGDVPTGVGKTALGAAMVRAQESRRSDRLFDDPYAEAFFAAAPGTFDSEQGSAVTRRGAMASWGAAFGVTRRHPNPVFRRLPPLCR